MNNLDAQILELVNNNISNKEIAILLGVTRNKVYKIIKKNGISRKASFYLRHDFFEKIDSEEKAYILGFLYADGFLSSKTDKVGLSLHYKDSYILDQMVSYLYVNSKKPKIYKAKQMRILSWFSSKMKMDLINLNCVPNKSLTLAFPPEGSVAPHLMRHFIRGIFDGDGCASISKQKNGYIRFKTFINSASETFIDSLMVEMKKTFPKISKSYCRFWKRKNPYFGVHIRGLEQQKHFYNFLYKDATMFLTRKKEKFEEFFNFKNEIRL